LNATTLVQSRSYLTQDSPLLDGELHFDFTKAKANVWLTMEARAQDQFSQTWIARAQYQTDHHGKIKADLSELFAMMQPQVPASQKTLFVPPKGWQWQVELTCYQGRQCIAKESVTRLFKLDSVQYIDVDEGQVQGALLLPEGKGPHPVVIIWGGNEGGIAGQLVRAGLLASRGFAVLIQAYFRYKTRPTACYDIPLENLQQAVQFCEQHAQIDAARIFGLGVAKGAEGLLAALAYQPALPIQSCVLLSPSSVVWQGFGKGKPQMRSSWSFNGEPLPFVKMQGERIVNQFMRARLVRRLHLQNRLAKWCRISLLPAYACVKSHSQEVQNALIPVEKIQARLLLLAGNRDKVWPSVFMSQTIMNRRDMSQEDEFITYDGAGHYFACPNVPTTVNWLATPGAGMVLAFGGRAKENAVAAKRSFHEVQRFFHSQM